MSTNQSIIERTPTVDAALHIAGKKLEDFTAPGDTKDETAYKLIKAVVNVLNENWKPDWSNMSQRKYFPWFDEKESGFGLSFDVADYWHTYTSVGSRLCYASKELCEHGIKLLETYYTDFVN